jgi:hypothetical protein
MKKYLVSSLMLGAFLLVLTGMPLQSSYAGHTFGGGHEQDHRGGDDRDHRGDKDKGHHKVPEPATLALLSSGIAGVGLYGYLKRKNRK